MELLEVKVDGRVLKKNEYLRNNDELTIANLPNNGTCSMEIKTRINPKKNLSLSGLYTSGETLCTQCESEGFRNMTFAPDRPSVLTERTTTIIAPKGKFKQLLSNGNPSERTLTADGREQITWHNPYANPGHLFALVAGNLAVKEDTFTTMSGRKVQLQVFVDPGNEEKANLALDSLKKFLKWDEENYGREYDLDCYQVVAVDAFNFGAMENKGLNIFNSSAALADPQTATDTRYEVVQAVIGHEATHNWRGNRVAPRDWHQVSLKEGLTTFTEQEFSADMNSRPVKRIDDVITMRESQFPEDASATAHPVRPPVIDSIENYYTPTIYEKGAELIRMMQTLVGKPNFRKGMDLYFDRFDGKTATIHDLVQAMQEVSGVDLTQFEDTWYNQAGTPTLDVSDAYNPATKEYRLTIKQSTPPTPGQPTKAPFHMPVRVGLLDAHGKDMPLQLEDAQKGLLTNGDILNLKEGETTFVFKNVAEKPTPSLLRNWSAPVKLNYNYTRDQLTFLMAHDSDGFNRWEAGQMLGVDILKELVTARQQGKVAAVDPRLIEAFKGVLQDPTIEPKLKARALELPSAEYLSELYPDGQVDVDAIDAARKQAQKAIGQGLEPLLVDTFNNNRSTESRPYEWNSADAGERAIKNTALSYLVAARPRKYVKLATAQFDQDHNMTDVRSAMKLILDYAGKKTRRDKLDAFYQGRKGNALAIQQWFADQALADRSDVLANVKRLLKNESYDPKIANNVRSLVGGFSNNSVYFHKKDGSGYQFVADQIIAFDKKNPMLAAGLSKSLSSPNRYDAVRQALMKAQLERINAVASSKQVKEIVGQALRSLAAQQSATAS